MAPAPSEPRHKSSFSTAAVHRPSGLFWIGLDGHRLFENHDDALIEKTEKFGRIVSVDPHCGIKIDVGERELFTLPPNPENFHDARPGVYRLRSTGETVKDPDLTTIWTIKEPASA